MTYQVLLGQIHDLQDKLPERANPLQHLPNMREGQTNRTCCPSVLTSVAGVARIAIDIDCSRAAASPVRASAAFSLRLQRILRRCFFFYFTTTHQTFLIENATTIKRQTRSFQTRRSCACSVEIRLDSECSCTHPADAASSCRCCSAVLRSRHVRKHDVHSGRCRYRFRHRTLNRWTVYTFPRELDFVLCI